VACQFNGILRLQTLLESVCVCVCVCARARVCVGGSVTYCRNNEKQVDTAFISVVMNNVDI